MTQTAEYLQILRQHECRDASYLQADPPLIFHRAQACRVVDIEGRSYLDLCAGFGVMALGHHHPVHRAVFAELAQEDAPVVHGMGDVYPSSAKAELFQYLSSLLPANLSVGSLALSGGQAVELALKTALLRRPGKLINFSGSYHGLDLGLLPLTSRQDFRGPFQSWLKQDLVVELPYGCKKEELEAAIDAIHADGQDLSAIIVEPIQGRAGIRPASMQWLKDLRQLADSSGALLIYDEVFTGLGRTGQWTFAEVVPCDLLCLGKALGGGLPLSACFGKAEYMNVWPENPGEAIHTGTFFGHPLACRLALATLRFMASENLLQQAREKGQYFREALAARIGQDPAVVEIRGQALMLGIVLREVGMGVRLMNDLRAQGVIALVSGQEGEVLSLTPPLIIEQKEIDQAVDAIGLRLGKWQK
ncbi:MAG: aspartate aminotransferase family protein [Oligoflexus sp.]